jgi:Leucine-rich repeat (LRR) protein
MNNNLIEEIPDNAFVNNRNLNFLVLAGNRISEIAGVKDLPNLQYLDLSRNMIEEVEADL